MAERSSLEQPDSLPDAPAFNVTWSHAVSLTTSLEKAYEKLGSLESLESVVKLSALTVAFEQQPVEYRDSDEALEGLANPYNLDFSTTEIERGHKRARFCFIERLDYKITHVDVQLVGSQTILARPDLSAEATVLYATYAKKQKIWVRKTRTFTRLPAANEIELCRIDELVQCAAPLLMAPLVKMSGKSSHKAHMLKYGELFEGDVHVHLL